jgi:hypothetical protein
MVLELELFYAKLGIGLLINSSQLSVFGYNRLTVLPVTALIKVFAGQCESC